MARGFVRKRGDVWYAYWRTPNGKQRSKAVSSRKKDAERYLTEVQADLMTGTYRELKSATFASFAERWLADYVALNVKPSTFQSYTSIVNKSLVPAFGDCELPAITTEDVQRFVAQLTKRTYQRRRPEAESQPRTTSSATVKKHLMVLKNMLNHAVLWGYLKHNPALAVRGPRLQHHEMDFLKPEEIKQLLAACDSWQRPFVMTAIFTGMRLGELVGLKWSDIDWEARTVSVQRSVWQGVFQSPKSARSVRTINLSPALTDELLRHKLQAPANTDDLIFTTPEGTMLDADNYRRRVFAPILKRAGLRQIRLHDLRHTFATLLLNQGENIKYVQYQLGHSSIQVTVDRYAHLMPEIHVGASARLDATVFGTADSGDKSLTRPQQTEQAGELSAPRPAVMLVGHRRGSCDGSVCDVAIGYLRM